MPALPPPSGLGFLAGLLLAALARASYIATVQAQVVITFENTDPRITWTPFVCNGTSDPASCDGGWTLLPLVGASSGSVTSTFGPGTSDDNILPQLFLPLRGTSLILRTSPSSNATANVTLTAAPSGVSITTLVDTSVGSLSAVDLPPDEDMLLAVTYVPRNDGVLARLDIDSITCDVPFANTDTDDEQPSLLCSPYFYKHAVGTARLLARPAQGHDRGRDARGLFGLILIIVGGFALVRWHRTKWKGGESFAMRRRRVAAGKARADPDVGMQV
ncbi:hypothetical protein EVG20_g5416 [Dentipellis fragilis]|uniref:Uncharacterized protein n=1 Tax=Dentipellis fragilis TaxID=205917 RepID=A0A4Y9YVA5_9AGAM|nr:hypothetical protein EVG20_g5416 [Dentipellis fragilis]